jgi:hypothetical protein
MSKRRQGMESWAGLEGFLKQQDEEGMSASMSKMRNKCKATAYEK